MNPSLRIIIVAAANLERDQFYGVNILKRSNLMICRMTKNINVF